MFVGREQFGSGNALIKVFDTERFLELEEVDLGLSFGTQSFSELEFLGDLSFALLTSDGQLAIVNAVVPIPAPAVLFLSAIGLLGIVRRRKVREHARHS
ncbi:MAG: PEP-CTERM sorting domain-containing protein [Pseudomonadota bacterium]